MTIMERCFEQVFPFWPRLSEKDQRILLTDANIDEIPKGSVVFNPLKKVSGIRIIITGLLRISIQTEQGGDLLLYQLQTGELCLLSIFSLMNKFNWDIYMETLEDSKIMVIPESAYMAVSKRNQEMDAFNNQLLFERMAEVIQITSEFAMADTEKRLAGLLLRYQKMRKDPVIVATHESIARDIGTARDVISRHLKQFAEAKLVTLGRGKVTILDAAGLQKLKYR